VLPGLRLRQKCRRIDDIGITEIMESLADPEKIRLAGYLNKEVSKED